MGRRAKGNIIPEGSVKPILRRPLCSTRKFGQKFILGAQKVRKWYLSAIPAVQTVFFCLGDSS